MNDPTTDSDLYYKNWLAQPAAFLDKLLALLYPGVKVNANPDSDDAPDPDPINADILTLADFKRRYKLTGLGPLAITAIEQARRITRAVGRLDDMGLCEFHIGLIYLHSQDYRGAVHQFEEARRQWAFVNNTAAICLAYLAEGAASYKTHAYETALAHYGRVEYMRARIQQKSLMAGEDEFGQGLQEALSIAQKLTREALQKQTTPDGESVDGDESAAQAAAPGDEPPAGSEAAYPPPTFPARQSADRLATPVPGHNKAADAYVWYRTRVRRQDDLLPGIKDAGWLLINRQSRDHLFQEGDPIVVISDSPQASVILEPFSADDQTSPRICLARAEMTGGFTREADGRVRLAANAQQIPVSGDDVFGYVVGLWLEVGDFEILES